MKKFLIVVIVLLIIIVGVFAFIRYTSPSYKNQVYANKITKEAVQNNDSSLCKKLAENLLLSEYMGPGATYILNCYAKVAVENENIDACPELSSNCLGAYFTYVKNTDSEICEIFQEGAPRDICYYEQSRALFDATFCEFIESNEDKDACYLGIASLKVDKELCNKIQNLNAKQNCLNEFGDYNIR